MTKKKSAKKRKHIPQRTCIGCHQVDEQRTLIRVVRSPQGVLVDLKGKMPGRGAYLHDNPACWARGLKGSLARALKTELSAEEIAELTRFMNDLLAPKETPGQDKQARE